MTRFKCLLLVDDDPIATFVNRAPLNKLSDSIEVATNGEEALNKLLDAKAVNNHCPKLIFLDINMPVKDGFEFMKSFNELDQQHKDHIVVVVLSTSNNDKDIQRMQDLGVKYFIQKPLTEEKIIDLLISFEQDLNIEIEQILDND